MLAFSESWLTGNISNSEISIAGYSDPIRCDRKYTEHPGGGLAVYLRNSVQFKEICSTSSANLEAVAIKVSPFSTSSFIMIVAYRPSSRTPLDPFMSNFLDEVLDKSSDIDDIVIMGDFNLNQLEPDNMTRRMDDICQTYNLHQLIDVPTRITDSTATLIDLIYVSDPSSIIQSDVIPLGISDHFGISVSNASSKRRNSNQQHLHITYHDLKAFDEKKFLSDVEAAPWHLIDLFDDIDEKLDTFYQIIEQLINWHAPKRQRRVKRESYPWINSTVIELIRQKSYALRLHLKNKSDFTRNFYKKARNRATEGIRQSKREYFTTSIEENKNNQKEIWKTLKKLLPSKRVTSPEIIRFEGKSYTSFLDIANCFNEFFSTVASRLTKDMPTAEPASSARLTHESLTLPAVTPNIVINVIGKLRNVKGTGLDDISMNFVKILSKSDRFACSLSLLINHSFNSGVFPSAWKSAKVIPLFKSGDIENVDNYRPISVLNCLSKVIERIAFDHIFSFLAKENLLHILQSGFRKHHSTLTALIHMIDTIYKDMDENKLTGALFLDLRKAFDTVDHRILLSKLQMFNPNKFMFQWLSSYLENRKQVVVFNGILSNEAIISTGVPQGSILGPLLFLMYINDLPMALTSEVILFADDTTAISHGATHCSVASDVQNNLTSISNYALKNRLIPHPQKTKIMLFSKQSQAVSIDDRIPLNLAGAQIDYTSSYKCLGFTLDEHLDYKLHLKDICKKVHYGISILRRVRLFLSEDTLISLANSLVLCHLDYCSPLLHNLLKSQLESLLKLQKQCARVILSQTRRSRSKPLFIRLNWLPIHQRIELNTCILMFKIENNLAPDYLNHMFQKQSDIHDHHTRSSASGCLHTTRGTGATHLKSFQYYGAKVWNSLPKSFRDIKSLDVFKLKCKLYFMDIFKAVSFVNYDFSV